jgi:hypothetical protein
MFDRTVWEPPESGAAARAGRTPRSARRGQPPDSNSAERGTRTSPAVPQPSFDIWARERTAGRPPRVGRIQLASWRKVGEDTPATTSPDSAPTRIRRMTAGPLIQRHLDIRGQSLKDLQDVYAAEEKAVGRTKLKSDIARLFGDDVTRTYGRPGVDLKEELKWIKEQIAEANALRNAKQKEKLRAKVEKKQTEQAHSAANNLPPVASTQAVAKKVLTPDEVREQARKQYDLGRSLGYSIDDVVFLVGNWLKDPKHDGISFYEHRLTAADFGALPKRLHDAYPNQLTLMDAVQGSGSYKDDIQFKVLQRGGGTMTAKTPTFHIQQGGVTNTFGFTYEMQQSRGALSARQNGNALVEEAYDDHLRDAAGEAAVALM